MLTNNHIEKNCTVYTARQVGQLINTLYMWLNNWEYTSFSFSFFFYTSFSSPPFFNLAVFECLLHFSSTLGSVYKNLTRNSGFRHPWALWNCSHTFVWMCIFGGQGRYYFHCLLKRMCAPRKFNTACEYIGTFNPLYNSGKEIA